MKYLTIAVVFLGITGTLISLRGLAWQPVGAQYARTDNEPDAAALPAIDGPAGEGAALAVTLAKGEDKKSTSDEKLMARLAAECASHLFDKSKNQPDNVRLLEQAAAHYRACLSHEHTVDDAALFADARKNLEQIDKLLAVAKSRPTQQPPAKIAEKAKAEKHDKPAPAPVVQTKKQEPLMFGPDGVIFRKERAGD
jgi:hypothetical protein